MGLSTKQVSSDGFDWGHRLLRSSGGLELSKPPPPTARRQYQQQQSEPLPCPRCGSTNTKFCYYNNYNKLQPRHFCKACKRHWTKGGALRNVPVGGGRKNNRPKTAAVSSIRSNTHIGITIQREQVGDQKKASSESSLYQALIPPLSSSSQLESTIVNTGNFNVKGLSRANSGDFLASTPPNLLHQNQTPVPFTFSTLSAFESNPSSMSASFGSSLSNAYNFTEGLLGSLEEATTTTTIMPTAISIVSQPWEEVPTTSSDVMDMANYWNWDDINTLIPTDQLNMQWDEAEIKP